MKIIIPKRKNAASHITKSRSKLVKTSLCGYTFKASSIEPVVEGGAELCSCSKCLKILEKNIDVLLK